MHDLRADYNSGGHKSRLHPRSIAGFVVVNPYAQQHHFDAQRMNARRIAMAVQP